jgi:NUMOD4 motif
MKELVELFIMANAMNGERFVSVHGFEGRFFISDFGRIVSCDLRKQTINFLHPFIDKEGYYQTQLRMKPHTRKVRVHCLVGEHFVDKKDTTHNVINHLTGIKTWNYYKDLEWGTVATNVKHAVETGLHNLKGSKHPNAKLTEKEVIEMRLLKSTTFVTCKELSIIYNISRRQVSDIISGKNWGWL